MSTKTTKHAANPQHKPRSARVVVVNPDGTPHRPNDGQVCNPRKRHRRRHNPSAVSGFGGGMAGLGAGTLLGTGAEVGMRQTTLGPMWRGGIELAVALAIGIPVGIFSPAVGGGIGAGLGSIGLINILTGLLFGTKASTTTTSTAASSTAAGTANKSVGEIDAIKSDLAAIKTTLARAALPPHQGSAPISAVYEEDLQLHELR